MGAIGSISAECTEAGAKTRFWKFFRGKAKKRGGIKG